MSFKPSAAGRRRLNAALGLVITSATFSTAVIPLRAVLALRWAELPRLRELHSKIVPPEQDPNPYLFALQAIQTEYILTILTAHALCEALINCTLAFALAEKSKSELFNIIERSEFLDKWVIAPKSVSDNYHFDKSSAVYETMKRMNKHRNFYLHNKAVIAVGDEVVFEGSKSEHKNMESDIEWIHRYISLPFDLAEHLRSYTEFVMPAILLNRETIVRAPQHKT